MQLAKTTNRDALIKASNNRDEVLGGSTAHLPIKPNNKIVMLRGAATAIHDKELFEGLSLYRLQTKKGN